EGGIVHEPLGEDDGSRPGLAHPLQYGVVAPAFLQLIDLGVRLQAGALREGSGVDPLDLDAEETIELRVGAGPCLPCHESLPLRRSLGRSELDFHLFQFTTKTDVWLDTSRSAEIPLRGPALKCRSPPQPPPGQPQ